MNPFDDFNLDLLKITKPDIIDPLDASDEPTIGDYPPIDKSTGITAITRSAIVCL